MIPWRLAGWLLLAAALASVGGWAGYRARDHQVAMLRAELASVRADGDTARGQIAAQQAATVALAEAADAHARRLAADAARARQTARDQGAVIEEVLRSVPSPPAPTAAACQPVEDLLRGYARAARDARRVPSVPNRPAAPAAPGTGAVRGAGAGSAGAADGAAAG